MCKALLALVIAFSLTACGSSNSSTTTESSSVSTSATLNNQTDRDTVYLNVMHQIVPQSVGQSDDALIGAGHSICDGLDRSGVNSQDEFYLFVISFTGQMKVLTEKQATEAIGVSIAAYCPKYKIYISGS